MKTETVVCCMLRMGGEKKEVCVVWGSIPPRPFGCKGIAALPRQCEIQCLFTDGVILESRGGFS